MVPPFAPAVQVDAILGDDDLDTDLLRKMAEEAECYVRSFPWCVEIHDKFFGDGYGGIVGLFLFRVTIRGFDIPDWIWTIVGDIPSCYLEFDGFPDPQSALARYIEGVEEWLAASPQDRATGDIIPINVPPGDEYLEMLKVRAETLRASILPCMRSGTSVAPSSSRVECRHEPGCDSGRAPRRRL